MKLYQIEVPDVIHVELAVHAARKHTTAKELILQMLKLGIMMLQSEQSTDVTFLIKEGDQERELILNKPPIYPSAFEKGWSR